MIVLTGTSGGLASVTLSTILSQKLLSPTEFRLSSRSGKTTSREAIEAGVEVRRGDFGDKESCVESFRGAEAVLIVSYPSVGEERFEFHKAAIDAAKEAGVKHMLYTSLTFGGLTGDESIAGVMKAHIKTVEYLKASGMDWTILRFGTYFHIWSNFAGFLQIGETGDKEVVIPNDGVGHWADRADMGEAAAYVVANWRNYVGQTINFTGPELLTVSDIVGKYAKFSGRKISVKTVGREAAIKYHKEQGSLPADQEAFLPNWASWFDAMAEGELDYLDPTMEKLLGRKAKKVDDMAE